MKAYTIIAGGSGVGKTSFIGALKHCAADLGIIIDAEKIITQRGEDTMERINRATEWCINNGVSLAQETTLSSPHPKPAIRQAKEADYYIRLNYIGLNAAEDCKRRVVNRVADGTVQMEQK